MSKPTNYDAERFASSPRRQESGNRWTDLGSALDEYLRLQEGHQSDQMKLVGPLVDDWIRSRDEIAKNNRFNGASFNPLRSININETTHSRILGQTLCPNSWA